MHDSCYCESLTTSFTSRLVLSNNHMWKQISHLKLYDAFKILVIIVIVGVTTSFTSRLALSNNQYVEANRPSKIIWLIKNISDNCYCKCLTTSFTSRLALSNNHYVEANRPFKIIWLIKNVSDNCNCESWTTSFTSRLVLSNNHYVEANKPSKITWLIKNVMSLIWLKIYINSLFTYHVIDWM